MTAGCCPLNLNIAHGDGGKTQTFLSAGTRTRKNTHFTFTKRRAAATGRMPHYLPRDGGRGVAGIGA